MKILVINPGSTSTKIAVYENETPLLVRNISHTVEELSVYSQVVDQFEFRKNLVLQELEANKIPFDFDAVIGRGGLVKPIPGGVYEVNEAMKRDTVHAMRTHACNLGGLIADKLASSLPNCRAFIADPGVVDELEDIARITGSPLMPKITIWHALNQKAIARRFAREQGTQYEDLDLIICHLGGGISTAVHRHGRAIDANNALDGEGPFSPERAGTLPAGQLIDLCFSGQFTKDELKKRISGRAGLTAHLGTTDVPVIIKSIEESNRWRRYCTLWEDRCYSPDRRDCLLRLCHFTTQKTYFFFSSDPYLSRRKRNGIIGFQCARGIERRTSDTNL